MKKLSLMLVLAVVCFAVTLPPNINDMVGDNAPGSDKPPYTRSVLIGPGGDLRCILGPQGKNIAIGDDGLAVAIITGDPTSNPATNPMEIYVAYSTNGGTLFTRYGAFSPELRRIYPGVDVVPDFATTAGHAFFVWQESPSGYNTGDMKAMLDEGTPDSPSFSTPMSLPQATTLFPWQVGVSVAPDNPAHLIATGWSYLNGGNNDIYCWISDDGGYSWTDPIYMGDNLPAANTASVKVRQGTGGYVAATYHNLYNWGGTDIEFPYFTESTDGGNTWLPRVALPVPYADGANSQFWWHELDLEVIDNEPWMVHTDLGVDSMWLFYPSAGGPGSWTWNVKNVRQLSTVDVWAGGTYYLCYSSQYPSVSYDATSGTILIGYKGYYYRGDTLTWADMNGAHVGGIYTVDGGVNWTVAHPMQQVLNDGSIAWSDWNATEIAHRLYNDGTDLWAYSVWVQDVVFNVYFEKGILQRFGAVEENSQGQPSVADLGVAPSVARNLCYATFNMQRSDNVTLNLYDVSGRVIASVFSGNLQKGEQRLPVNTSAVANGTYFLVLEGASGKQVTKVVIAH